MNYFKKIAVSKALGVGLGEVFIMSDADEECFYRITENGLEIRIAREWYPSVQFEDIMSGKLGDIISIRSA